MVHPISVPRIAGGSIIKDLTGGNDMEWLLEAYDHALEKEMLKAVSQEAPWKLVEYFSRLKRDSGTEGEREAASYIARQLSSMDIPHQVYEPELFLSVPQWAKLAIVSPSHAEIQCKTPSFSHSTEGEAVEGSLVYISIEAGEKADYVLDSGVRDIPHDVEGRIVLTEGIFSPQIAWELESRGAIGQIYIHPGSLIHESIISTIWGTPTLDNMNRIPKTPVVSVNQPDGQKLRDLCRAGQPRVALQTKLSVGWSRCPVPVAEIRGKVEPEKFVLIHGHYDAWHFGVGDNATGNAACLELARILHTYKDQLFRSARVAWWPGHSTGRYAGSTWYADQFAIDLAENCIVQMNIDSPGCRWADAYDGVMWMTEVENFCKKAIHDVTGKRARGIRPMRAGDYSFNHIGLTSMYMLMSTIPESVKREKGFYPVGGCAGNSWVWHTENDTLEVADPQVLERDIRVYLGSIFRLLNAFILPFDFTRWTEGCRKVVEDYQSQGGDLIDLQPVMEENRALETSLSALYSKVQKAYFEKQPGIDRFRAVNQCLLELGRILIPIEYTRGERYSHDPATPIPPFPDLEKVRDSARFSRESNEYRFLKAQLVRGRNKAVDALRRARRTVERCLEELRARGV